MDSVAYKILEELEFDGITDYGDHYRACCKLHGGDNPTAFVMNKKSLKWYCHRCHEGGKAEKLVKLLAPDRADELLEGVEEETKVPVVELDRDEAIEWLNANRIRSPPKPKVRIKGEIEFDRFKKDTLMEFNAETCERVTINGRTYHSKLVIPIDGGFGLRALDGSTPKWTYTKGVNLSHILFRRPRRGRRKPYDTIIVVEGMFDVFAFYEAMETYQVGENVEVVSTFTCHMSKEQMKLLLQENCKIVMCYDGDEPGRKGNQQAAKLLKDKVDFEILQLPEGKDPDDVPRWWLAREVERFTK